MTDFPSYTLGTVSVSNGDIAIVGDGTIWTGINARAGDTIVIGTSVAKIVDVTDDTHLKIDAWPFTTVTAGTSYKIVQDSPLRFVGGQAMADVSSLIAVLRANGLLWYLPQGYTDPNDIVPALTADDGQGILRIDTGALWVMSGGTWVAAGVYKGFNYKGAYNPATTYVANDVLTSGGSVYIVTAPTTGNAPPNASYYDVFASKGDTGTIAVGTVTTGAGGSSAAVTNVGTSTAAIFDFTIPAGKTYSATSTTSLAIGTGSKAFTTQAGLAYTNGARVRASSAANTTNWMEGLITYSGTTLTMTSDKTNGSGTHTDWNLNVVGEPGAGDLTAANNLSDVANASTALTNLGGTTVGKDIFTASDAAAARAVIGLGKGHIFGLTLSNNATDATNDIDIAAGEAADEDGNLMVLSSGLTKRLDAAWAVGTGNGGLDTGSIANTTYHVWLIQRSDTGVVDALFSTSPSSPTMPANYDRKRRIGAILRESAAIVAFRQIGDVFKRVTQAVVRNSTSAVTDTLLDMLVPTGVKVAPLLVVDQQQGTAGNVVQLIDDGDATTANVSMSRTTLASDYGLAIDTGHFVTNTSGQLRYSLLITSGTATSARVQTQGWIDGRGQ